MNNYSIKQRVQATVEQILPFGVFARLDDGTRAYIRRRELDLDADVEPSKVVRQGERIDAIVIAASDASKNIELSRRATLTDPWIEFARRFRKGEVVRGSVQSLQSHGAFVRVTAGINGFVPLEEFAMWRIEKPEDELWVGDSIEAVITNLDPSRKKLWLSIKSRSEAFDQAVGVIERLEERKATEINPDVTVDPLNADLDKPDPDQLERVGHIFVVDDHDGIRNGLVEWLQRRSYRVSAARSVPEALERIKSDQHSVLFIDLNLSDGDGLELVRQVRTDGNRARVCVMSSPEWLTQRASEIQAAGVIQVFDKPLDLSEVDHFLMQLGRGESFPTMTRRMPHIAFQNITGLNEFLGIQWQEITSSRRLQTALERLTEIALAEKTILFEMDSTRHRISTLAEAGILELNRKALYELDDSPVRDVIVDGEIVLLQNATGQGRFRKLSDLFEFESCIGIPIEVVGEIHHALFFFHRKPDNFTLSRQRSAWLGAIWLGAILEAQVLDQRLHAANPLLLSGELAVSLAHEVNNKVSGLELQIRNFPAAPDSSTNLHTAILELQNSILDLKSIVEPFQQMMRPKDVSATFDLNDVLRRATTLLRPLARKERAKIILRLTDEILPVMGNDIALQQVFLNLMLNALQQMALKPAGRRLLEITSTWEDGNSACPIQVRFLDTGPGIHKQLFDRIFAMGFSTRGGSGLGLSIARSLINSVGGRISVQESFIALGTTFLIELPAANWRQGE